MSSAVGDLADAVTTGQRNGLAQAITLVESTRADHRAEATQLIERILPGTGDAIRIGVSGPPGVGKSSIIEALGLHVLDAGHDLAVLAVDPSSPRSGGSILGDKTRMELLGRDERAFIRPSPSGTTSGGVARRTRESLLVCEAAGFDVVIVETVGSGQSDVAVADMVDVFVLLVQPSSGDELQGIKRGVMELADLVVVTKSDGALVDAAAQSVADHRAALSLLHQHDAPAVIACSSKTKEGIADVWDAIVSWRVSQLESGRLDERRQQQALRWLWSEVNEGVRERLRASHDVQRLTPEIEAAVGSGTLAPPTGARALLEAFRTE